MAQVLRLFGRPSSSNTQKAMWALHEAQKAFELTLASARLGAGSQLLSEETGMQPYGVVDTPDYQKMCPTKQIPALLDGDLALWESHSIVRYVAMKYAPQLHLDSAEGMARCSPWMDWALAKNITMGCNHDLVDQIARIPPGKRDMSLVLAAHQGYLDRLQLVEDRLQETGAFLAGERFSVADIAIGAEVSRWSCAVERWARDAAEDLIEPPPKMPHLPGLNAYLLRLQERPAFLSGCFSHEREHHGLEPSGHDAVPLFGPAAAIL